MSGEVETTLIVWHHTIPFIQDLISYYQKHTLGANFPFVNTTLLYPYNNPSTHGNGM